MNPSADANEENHVGKPLLHRREFLALGSAGLLAPLFGDLAWAEPLALEAVVRPMSVGYIAGSETFRNLRRLPRKIRRPGLKGEGDEIEPSPVVVPAARLFQGDTSFPGRPLRIRIDGLYPPLALELKRRRELPLAADLDVFFPSPDPAIESPVLFMAWSFRRRPGWNPSPPVSFRFPLDWQALPQFVLRVQQAAEAPPVVLRTKFTLDNESGRPRLRRGVYLLGLAPGAWDGEVKLAEVGRRAPSELFSVLVSMNPEGEA
ncbi:MAG TPA: hypothetical protein VGG03_18015 [Thermoanaerobaculia bacterium]|jgi:hypothetical protein